MTKITPWIIAAIAASFVHESAAFAPSKEARVRNSVPRLYMAEKKEGGIFGAIGNFFEELDAFVDDATARRLGNGAQYYGKRKSNFYGSNDSGRKLDRNTPDPMEDYQGPKQAGYFKWMQDPETGEMKPVTRMKEKNIERNPNYWDKVFKED
uniref:PS II complex 12 kDa extrinsic protein n=1 Tax=Odontella aurita TaxID=265563 RepID=A0A7S4JJ21_9STRA|mmetsp:Transcript_46930/g.142146  ORF Transcript_46930/g.142146 Transcript_46930/m.142146 type:complete len:152 (+) Transcript_46930:129-584(+)